MQCGDCSHGASIASLYLKLCVFVFKTLHDIAYTPHAVGRLNLNSAREYLHRLQIHSYVLSLRLNKQCMRFFDTNQNGVMRCMSSELDGVILLHRPEWHDRIPV